LAQGLASFHCVSCLGLERRWSRDPAPMSRKYQDRIAQSSGVASSKAFESDFGKRALLKYGWQEGQGLGRLRNGRTECIQGTRREEKKGLGAEKRKADDDQWDNWWSDCFNDIAKRLNSQESLDGSSQASPAAQSEASSSDSDSEEAATQAAGGRITAVKKAGAMAGKLRRVLRQETPKV